jgi:hypothetical protein
MLEPSPTPQREIAGALGLIEAVPGDADSPLPCLG